MSSERKFDHLIDQVKLSPGTLMWYTHTLRRLVAASHNELKELMDIYDKAYAGEGVIKGSEHDHAMGAIDTIRRR